MSEPCNIASALSRQAAERPEALAIAYPSGHYGGLVSYERLSFAELDRASDELARGLLAMDIAPGTRVAVLIKPGRNFFVSIFGLLKAGLVMVCIDPGIGLKNMKRCLAEAAPEVFLGIPAAHIARWLFGWARRSVKRAIVVDGWLPLTSFGSVCKRGQGRSESLAQTRAEDQAAILFTSGSTGAPKGAIYEHGMFVAQVDALRTLYDIEPGEIDCATFPLFALFAPALGMSAVVPQMGFTRPGKVEPERLRQALEEFQVTNLFGSPALLNTFGRWCEQTGASFPHLRRVISAGAPVPWPVMQRIEQATADGVEVFTPYGATECLPVASIGSATIGKETWAETERGRGVCIGSVVPSIECHVIPISDEPIIGWDDGMALPVDEIGEVVVDGPQRTKAYFHRDEATVQSKIRATDGRLFHRMGDCAYRDEQGRLWFCGRKAHRVVTSERTYFSVTCEGVFNAHPAVFRSALVRLQIADATRPGICIECEPGHNASEELLQELLDQAKANEVTRGIEHLFFHPSFPVDIRHNAKINREALSTWAQQELAHA